MPRHAGLTGLALAAAGAALALTLPRPGLCSLAWFAPAVLVFHAGRATSAAGAARAGLVFGAAFAGTALHWIFLTCRFAGMGLAASFVAWAALTAVLCLNWALFAAAGRAAAQRLPEAARPWAWAVLWTALEHASLRWTPRLGADLLSYTQWRHAALIQVGALAGPHALGLVIIAFNAALAGVWAARGGPRKELLGRAAGLLAPAGLAAGCLGYGLFAMGARLDFLAAAHRGPTAVVLQPNIDQYRKWDGAFAAEIRSGFEALLAAPVPPDSLVVWPESALPGWLDDPENSSWMAERAARAGAPMAVGAIAEVAGRRHNAAVLVEPDGTASALYAKRRLVPFGEFVPLRALIQPFIGILSQMGDFDAGGPAQALWDTPLGPAAPSLCYEAVFPRLALADAARGARVLLNLTNDGWYKDTWGPAQHFQTNAFRAVETRASVVRSANTGVSGVIDPWGVVVASAPVMTRGRLDVAFPLEDPFPDGSPYARTGDWLGVGALLASAALAVLAWRRRP
ncbi:MAG: apolipoprotein N-acyltransferase [Elusimicrobia bacterium]|nr:apolipoprotein N-acyltransferase [Elusimicrobiota bacterium]